jgi:hypothetical protein
LIATRHIPRFRTAKKADFFIGGAAKSGTTWLQLLLDAHPEINCSGEGHFGSGLAPLLKMALDRYGQLLAQESKLIFNEIQGYCRLEPSDLKYILGSCIALLLLRQSERKPARVIGEKTPSNVRYFDLLHDLFPDAKFLQIVRDGRDCAVSSWFHNLRMARARTLREHKSVEAYAIKQAEHWAGEMDGSQAFIMKHPEAFSRSGMRI